MNLCNWSCTRTFRRSSRTHSDSCLASWTSWTGDVGALRPRPTKVRDLRLVVDGGVVRLANVAVNVSGK